MKSIFLFFFIFIFLFCNQWSKAQFAIPGNGTQPVVGGYETNLEGEILPYFSSYQQFANEALLSRCTDGNKIIKWQSAVVPDDFNSDYCYFYFLAGHSTGTSKADRHFDFYINGEKYLTFVTPQKRKPPFTWSYTGKDSVQLIFDATFLDIHTDAHGNLFLKVPKKLITPGKPLTFSIIGQKENSNDWFMIFRYKYVEKIIIDPSSLLVASGEGIKQIVRVKADHTFVSDDTLNLKLLSRNYKLFIHPGYNYFELPVDTVEALKNETINAAVGNKFEIKFKVTFQPIHRREVDIIHHSHNDIGYSNLQEDVAKIQNDNIRNALKLIEKTKDYPTGSRFVWNIESVWAVDNYLNEANDKEKTIFFDAVRKKQICLSGHYANILTGLCKPEELGWITERAVQLRNEFHLPINSVMLTDIPGVSWSEVQSLADNGFKYFSCGPNYQPQFPDLGERIGGTIRELGEKPFYWMSENGKSKILFWTAGRGYSLFHQIPFADLDEKRKDKLSDYMHELDSIGYPYDIVQLRYNIKTDNGPADSTLCDFVKTWNEKYISPKLVITSVSEMMEKFEKQYGKLLPVFSGDFTPYWEDGAYSTAKEEGEIRVLSERLIQLQKYYALNTSKNYDANLFYLARRSVVMFHEHTWGSWNSISDPDNPFTTRQWEYKKRFCDSAKYYVRQIEIAMKHDIITGKQVEIWNTLDWKRSGYVETETPPEGENISVTDDKGSIIPYQKLKNGKICFIARDVPAKNKKNYFFSQSPAKSSTKNEFAKSCKLIIDSVTGAVRSLKTNEREWINHDGFPGINCVLYIAGLDPENFSATHFVKTEMKDSGEVLTRYEITCSSEGSNGVKYIITQFNGLNMLLLSAVIDKKPIREKESVHIAFPFALKNVTTRIGIDDTFITPEHGQLSAANKDFYSVQRWIDVSEISRGVTISSPQCALFETGNMIDERRINRGEKLWKKSNSSSPLIFAYAMNNYWNTNYKADQGGIVQFDFYLQLHEKFSVTDAERFGIESNQPLIAIQK